MRRRAVGLAWCATALLVSPSFSACGGPFATDNPKETPTPECAPLDLSKPIGTLKLTRMFEGGGDVTRPTDMRVLPDGRAFVVSQDAVVWMVPEVSPEAALEPWLDLTDRVETRIDCCREEGLLSLAFHPNFAKNGELFVLYSKMTDRRYTDTVISRFTVDDPQEGKPDPEKEEVLIQVEQPSAVHNGGQLRFGPDGYLYFSLGDGGGSRDPEENGQDRSTILGTISRIDVDRIQGDKPYAIPEDNPFVDDPEAAPEIFAYGFRNVWRFDIHPETGELWAGDVGQASFEELDIVVPGGNYGWKIMEGPECKHPDPEHGCEPPNYVPPIHSYGREVGASITAGVFYGGDAVPELMGQFLFTDFRSGTLWTVRGDASAGYEVVPLMDTGLQVSTFSKDAEGEVYLVHWGDAEVYRLDRQRGSKGLSWAPKLSETGCFQDLEKRVWVDNAVPYAVQVPLWSDGADKERALAVPPKRRIDASDEDEVWKLPVGATTAKTFLRDGHPLETRFLVHAEENRWLGATYRWNEGGTDARLLEGNDRVTATIRGESWTFPSRNDCFKCHTRAAGQVLGLYSGQLVDPDEEGGPFESLLELSLFDEEPPEDPEAWPALDDEDAPVSARARAYLASNCAHCHRPGGPTNSGLDLRYSTTLRDTNACDKKPLDNLGIRRARLIAPGAPERSVLLRRLTSTEENVRMPPLGRTVVDEAAVKVVEEWIEGVGGCEG